MIILVLWCNKFPPEDHWMVPVKYDTHTQLTDEPWTPGAGKMVQRASIKSGGIGDSSVARAPAAGGLR